MRDGTLSPPAVWSTPCCTSASGSSPGARTRDRLAMGTQRTRGQWRSMLNSNLLIVFPCRSRTSSNQHRAMQCRNIVPEIPEQYEEMKPLVYWTKTKCNAIHDDVNVQQYNSCRTEIYCEDQGKGRAKGRLSTRIRKVTQRSFIDYRLSIIDLNFPEALH